MHDVTILLLAFRGPEHTRACVRSLLDDPSSRDLPIVIVDNGSDDGSAETLEREFREVSVIRLNENRGFAGGVNYAIPRIDTKYIALLNNDMRVPHGWLDQPLRLLRTSPALGCVGATVRSWDGTVVEFEGRLEDAFGISCPPSVEGSLADRPTPDRPTLFVSGGAMVFDREAAEEIGGFDESFFLYQEDVDFCWRLWLVGRGSFLSSQAVVFHRGGASSRLLDRRWVQSHNTANVLATFFKNAEARTLDVLFGPLLLTLRARARLAGDQASFHQGVEEVLGRLSALVEARQTVQDTRIVGDDELFSQTGHPLGFLLRDVTGASFPVAFAADWTSASAVADQLTEVLRYEEDLPERTRAFLSIDRNVADRTRRMEVSAREKALDRKEEIIARSRGVIAELALLVAAGEEAPEITRRHCEEIGRMRLLEKTLQNLAAEYGLPEAPGEAASEILRNRLLVAHAVGQERLNAFRREQQFLATAAAAREQALRSRLDDLEQELGFLRSQLELVEGTRAWRTRQWLLRVKDSLRTFARARVL
jgi:GT2 family glycosyltransferase